ncbi:MAG: GDSL-type esterase/lipase family protein [Pseudomonadales bacterium]
MRKLKIGLLRSTLRVLLLTLAAAALPANASNGPDYQHGKNSIKHAQPGRARGNWFASWATASKVQSPFDPPTPAFNDVTLRQIVRVSRGGQQVRVWLTNELGTEPLTVQSANVALQAQADAIKPGSKRRLFFNGERTITIAPGARVLSDPVRLRVPDLADLSISMHLPQDLSAQTSPASYHVRALQTSYYAAGDQTDSSSLDAATTTTAWFYLAAVDIRDRKAGPVIAAYGDSITDGDQRSDMEPVDLNARYPNFLARKLLRSSNAAVINAGISGNQVTSTFIGENMQARLDRDVLTQTGVTHIIILGGINDIGLPVLLGAPAGASAEALIAAHQQIAARARARGLVVIGGTITPSGSSALPGYNTAATNATRENVNAWIRGSDAYDIVVDFDALLADPQDPSVMRADLTADGLHPNTEGYRAMAQAVARALRRSQR